ncbi:hypothetical protein PRUPE_1G325500 [Prunus persica]|nr:hypothetical protein PRUPE_1G325500 [Prunus persica]ONI31697.1 hypothetical protein PRUPE_1G325500 [Prunus persica]
MARKGYRSLEYRSDLLKFHRIMERIRENVREPLCTVPAYSTCAIGTLLEVTYAIGTVRGYL